MWIQIRSFDGKKSMQVDDLSKLTKIEQLREKLVETFGADPERQRLFYRGKQLEDGHSLYDYDVRLNDIIQIMVRAPMPKEVSPSKSSSQGSEGRPDSGFASEISDSERSGGSHNEVAMDVDEAPSCSGESSGLRGLYKVGDVIDAMDVSMGAWFEADIVKITTAKDDGMIYHVKYDGYDEQGIVKLRSQYLRPRARSYLKFENIKEGDIVMANYNSDEPTERGFWYDVKVLKKKSSRTYKELRGDVLLGPSGDVLKDCRIKFTDEIFKIEKQGEATCDKDAMESEGSSVKRANKPDCDFCKDNEKKKCKYCACHVCGGKDEPDKQLMCDECDMAYHIFCLDPPMSEIPDIDEWYCPLCKTDDTVIVKAGEKLKHSKKKSAMASAKGTCNRDWGKGMACQGRSKVCTIVPPNHFGEIPGIHVGQLWKFRVTVSEAGVHRPHVAGIHGREIEGAYSIVLAGGYEDDKDCGDYFYYTGSGGRDLSGNKRTAEQSCDQKLTKMNQALARNCAAPINNKQGNEAKDWKAGKPVRVIRSCKGRKHSKYAPEEGNRYDGLYKVQKYWPEKGKSGFIVWRYLLKRDDPQPAPWTKEGLKKIKMLGIEIEYPDGYLEAMAAKEKEKERVRKEKEGISDSDGEESSGSKKGKKKGKGKRKKGTDDDVADSPKPSAKKAKLDITSDMMKQIKADEANKKQWEDVLEEAKSGKKFLSCVEEAFTCICCQDVAYIPITTPCLHNVCKSCLQRSFKADVHSCPTCRHELGKGFSMASNKVLSAILKELFPGYEAGR
ncbi:E3 ubiquitin-protein ligase UHRF1-like [Amphiura filiformis]|uniref:E3 ubiquitin-protein ligase UHRF1-like n=1 Tax=Amphiura filiformis TaxID=82378 RepID=UPI003B2204FC